MFILLYAIYHSSDILVLADLISTFNTLLMNFGSTFLFSSFFQSLHSHSYFAIMSWTGGMQCSNWQDQVK